MNKLAFVGTLTFMPLQSSVNSVLAGSSAFKYDVYKHHNLKADEPGNSDLAGSPPLGYDVYQGNELPSPHRDSYD